ncbi:MAG: type VI secretion system tube protein Hcp [Desulfobacterales bacterium]|nr:type VI secretion system tube protein Hcp [Desulfobacterales bacterium]
MVNDVIICFCRALGGQNNAGGPSSSQNRHQYLKIELKNAIVSQVSPSVVAGGDSQGNLRAEVFRREVDLRRTGCRWQEGRQGQHPGRLEPGQQHSEPHLIGSYVENTAEPVFRRFS